MYDLAAAPAVAVYGLDELFAESEPVYCTSQESAVREWSSEERLDLNGLQECNPIFTSDLRAYLSEEPSRHQRLPRKIHRLPCIRRFAPRSSNRAAIPQIYLLCLCFLELIFGDIKALNGADDFRAVKLGWCKHDIFFLA